MITGDSTDTHEAVLASKSFKPRQSPLTRSLSLSNGKAGNPKTRAPSDGTQLKCSHCGNQKHTQETYFKLHGYPEWWADLQVRKRKDATSADGGSSQAVVVMAETPAKTETRLSLSTPTESAEPPVESVSTDPGICSSALLSPSRDDDDSNAWVVDSGASDHMTFDPADFAQKTQTQKTCIANANGILSPITGADTVNLSPTLSLTHTLLVPSLSHKLLSMSQVTEALNCVVLMYFKFCLLQDILTKEIIGRGTRRGDSTMWMILVWTKHITCVIRLTIKNDIFGFDIVD
jgi:hypothetical protein